MPLASMTDAHKPATTADKKNRLMDTSRVADLVAAMRVSTRLSEGYEDCGRAVNEIIDNMAELVKVPHAP
jgi:hypothetical protein